MCSFCMWKTLKKEFTATLVWGGGHECDCTAFTARPDDGNSIAAEKFEIAVANMKKMVDDSLSCWILMAEVHLPQQIELYQLIIFWNTMSKRGLGFQNKNKVDVKEKFHFLCAIFTVYKHILSVIWSIINEKSSEMCWNEAM